MKNQTRLYRFYNYQAGKTGAPFALCDWHKAEYKVPDTCTMSHIADGALEECFLCQQEREDREEAEA